MIEVLRSTVEPTVLHCLDCTWDQHCHNALLLYQLSPLGFHSNKVVEIQCLEKIKSKPLEAALCKGGSIFIWIWTVLPEYDEPFAMWGIPNLKIVLPEHVEIASAGFNCYIAYYIEFQQEMPIKYDYLPVTAPA